MELRTLRTFQRVAEELLKGCGCTGLYTGCGHHSNSAAGERAAHPSV